MLDDGNRIGQNACVARDDERGRRSSPLRLRLPRISPALRGVSVDRAKQILADTGFGWRVRRVDGSEPDDRDRILGQSWEADAAGGIDIVAVRTR